MPRVPQKEKAYFMHKAGNFYGRFKNMIDSSLYFLTMSYRTDSTVGSLYKDLGVAYGLKGKLDSSVYFTLKALNYNPNDIGLYYNLGVTYYMAASDAKKKGRVDLYKQYMAKAQYFFDLYKKKKGEVKK
jgi:tetratricopeptide (TPR) repeat protein